MSSNNNEYRVNMVRICQLDGSDMKTYDNKVTVGNLFDNQRQIMYLRIKSNGISVLTQDYRELQWIHKSSANGIATIYSPKSKIIIIYDKDDQSLVHFFNTLETCLAQEPESESATVNSIRLQPRQEQIELMVDQLVKSIHSGDSNQAADITKRLAELQVNIQFSLNNKNDHQEINMNELTANTNRIKLSDTILRFTLSIECFSKTDPLIVPIDIRSGTTLHSLKQKIENEIGIKSTDQYWFAFKRYPIPDDYVFGSSISFTSTENQRQSSVKALQSGDTIILYIAQMSSMS